MSINLRFILWLLFIALVGGIFYSQINSGLKVETNILKLLPETEVDPFAEKAFARFSENNFKNVIFATKSEQKSDAIAGAQFLSSKLKQSASVHSLQSQLSEEEQEAVGKLYFKHRFHLLSNSDRALLQNKGAEPFTDYTIQMVYSPLSSQLIQLLPQDPLLLSYRYLQQMSDTSFANKSPSNTTDHSSEFIDDILVIYSDGAYYSMITATLAASPFDSDAQASIRQILEGFQLNHPNTELLFTGAIFYAQHAATSAKSEISTIGLGSLIGVILLLIIAFRSVLPLTLTLVSLGVGILAGFTAVNAFFGSIHILTLVFGSSLIGVAVDYAFHYFASANESKRPLPIIFGAISLGLVSSVIGYAALFTTPFPGLQQMALFCATGLVGAYLTVILLFDRVPSKVQTPHKLLLVFIAHSRISQSASKKPFLLALLALPLIALWLLMNTSDDNDNIRQLQSVPPALHQQEKTIQDLVSAPAPNQFFVVKGPSPDQVLTKLESVNDQLDGLIAQGAIDDYHHAAHFVPSSTQQESDYRLVRRHTNPTTLQTLLELGLITSKQLEKLVQSISESQSNVLTLNNWLASPLGQRFSYLWLDKIDGEYAAIITLHNINDITALESLADNNSTLYFINKVEKVSSLFSQYRELSLIMLAIAIAVIMLVLAVRYNLIVASLIVLGPIIAASVAITANIVINSSFNLFSALALFLVFGIGIDYGLFYAESKKRSPYIYLAIGLSAITTFLSFGLLSLSATPAIHAFGLTMLSGILTVFVLSPILGHQIYQAKGLKHDSST